MQSQSIFSSETKGNNSDDLTKQTEALIMYLKDLIQPSFEKTRYWISVASKNNSAHLKCYLLPELLDQLQYEFAYQDAITNLSEKEKMEVLNAHPKSYSAIYANASKEYDNIYKILHEISEKKTASHEQIKQLEDFRNVKFDNYKPAFDKMGEVLKLIKALPQMSELASCKV